MIVRPRPHWFPMLFVVRGSVLPHIAPQLIFTTAIAILVTAWHGVVYEWKVTLTFVPFSLIGLTLAIFLGFRNNTSYARYWEARVLWGTLMIEARNLSRQAMTLVDDARQAPPFVRLLIAFTHALRHQLRGTDPKADFARLLTPAECERLSSAQFKPAVLLLMASEWMAARRREGTLSQTMALAMEAPLCKIGEALAGCERIANTPIPFTYAVIIHRTIYLYCLLLPFALVDSIGPMTPIIVAFISYTFFALEALGAEIEDPFGREPNDLALDALSINVEATLRETMGERDLPSPPAPVGYVQT